jgi:hypothetical protein
MIKNINKIVGACSNFGWGQEWWGDLREGDHLEDSDIHERIILRWLFKRWDGGIELD